VNWSEFTTIYNNINPALTSSVNNVVASMLSGVSGILTTAMTLYVAVVGLMVISGRMAMPIRDVWFLFAKAAVVAVFLQASQYDTYVRDFFLTTLPNSLTTGITGSAGTVGASSFDHIWNKAFGGGLAVWKNTSWTDIGLQILIVVYWMAAAVATAFGFLVWMASHVFIGLFVAIGPAMICMFLFSPTRPMFERWIGALVSMTLLQVMVVILLVVLIGAENTLLANISTAGGGGTGTGGAIAQVQVLFGAIILFVVAVAVIVQLPGAASSLAGGMHFYAQSFGRATFGRAAAAGQSVTAGIRGMAGNAGRAAQARLTGSHTMPPGPSLSTSVTTGRS
jgi:type IV secretion system protein VirB6